LAFSSCTSLVVYGSNLGSTLGIGIFPTNISNLIYLTPISYSVVVSILFSDGWLERGSLTSNTRFVFKQSISRSDYVISTFLTLSHYCTSLPLIKKGLRKGTLSYALLFGTRFLPCFNEFYELFYKD
jgi:hypothetical protein